METEADSDSDSERLRVEFFERLAKQAAVQILRSRDPRDLVIYVYSIYRFVSLPLILHLFFFFPLLAAFRSREDRKVPLFLGAGFFFLTETELMLARSESTFRLELGMLVAG